jgi:hypothetical protein
MKKLGGKFRITKEKFYFDETYYNPDIVLRDRKSGKIKAILEVEQGTRKHVVGGIITADYCMGLIKEKPIMLILALNKQDLKDYKKREKMLRHYIKNIRKLVFDDFNYIKKFLIKI